MKTNNEIKKMSAVELMGTFCPQGEAVSGIEINQDFDNEITTLLFDDKAIEICGSVVTVVEYYTASENVSHTVDKATREIGLSSARIGTGDTFIRIVRK